MGALQITLGLICVAVTVVAVAMLVRTVIQMVRTVRLGQPDPTRNGPIGARVVTTVKEVLGHTRMLKWTKVGIAHWFVMMGFLGMLLVVAEAYGEVFQPSFELPLLGEWAPWNLWVEVLGWATVVGILVLIVIRQLHHPRRAERQSRFAGSHMGRAYFIEGIVLVEGLGVVCIRAVKHAAGLIHPPVWAAPLTHALGSVAPSSTTLISVLAAIKILSGMAFIVAISLNMTMGVAWHRFTAFFNIYFKRNADGAVALGAAKPMMSGGKPLDFEEADPDTDVFGAGKVEDFSWKGWLDFTTCTECGRCQSQCPAWN
ncbi:Fe-S oxidoreductase, partial [Streptoalloteichus tenebrarius]